MFCLIGINRMKPIHMKPVMKFLNQRFRFNRVQEKNYSFRSVSTGFAIAARTDR